MCVRQEKTGTTLLIISGKDSPLSQSYFRLQHPHRPHSMLVPESLVGSYYVPCWSFIHRILTLLVMENPLVCSGREPEMPRDSCNYCKYNNVWSTSRTIASIRMWMGELNQIPYNINKLYAPPSIESLLKIYIGHAFSPSLKHVLSPCCIGIKKNLLFARILDHTYQKVGEILHWIYHKRQSTFCYFWLGMTSDVTSIWKPGRGEPSTPLLPLGTLLYLESTAKCGGT